MDEKTKEAIRLHVSGATVRHMPPFEELMSFKNGFELSQEFIDEWVVPFYMNIGYTTDEWINQVISVKNTITTDIIEKNLGDFNWRTRQTGAFFAAITNKPQYIDIIGTHLLKSEVCYAGGVYCQVFASFNTVDCVEYLNAYLDYYLSKPDLWFDQREAMEAIHYLDKRNATNHFERHIDNWHAFIKNKPYWSKEISTEKLERELAVLKAVQQAD
jgi:hypothetical protein